MSVTRVGRPPEHGVRPMHRRGARRRESETMLAALLAIAVAFPDDALLARIAAGAIVETSNIDDKVVHYTFAARIDAPVARVTAAASDMCSAAKRDPNSTVRFSAPQNVEPLSCAQSMAFRPSCPTSSSSRCSRCPRAKTCNASSSRGCGSGPAESYSPRCIALHRSMSMPNLFESSVHSAVQRSVHCSDCGSRPNLGHASRHAASRRQPPTAVAATVAANNTTRKPNLEVFEQLIQRSAARPRDVDEHEAHLVLRPFAPEHGVAA